MLRNQSKILLYGVREYLEPASIPKYINQLEKPYIFHPILIKKKGKAKKREDLTDMEEFYYIDICRFYKQILPEGFPKTPVIGCAGLIKGRKRGAIGYARSYPGGTFELRKYAPAHIKWRNKTGLPVRIQGKIDVTDTEETGPRRYCCHNSFMSFSGFFMLREGKGSIPYTSLAIDLPLPTYEYPIIIQDCSFYKDGVMINSGEIILVNGKAWPNLNVKRRQYRFYILNASKTRFFNLRLSNDMSITVIGGVKGLLTSPVAKKEILMAPGEIVDVLIDFSGQAKGSKIILKNQVPASSYPAASVSNPETSGQIMSFFIPENEAISVRPVKLPDKLRL
jgi:hypothetical protein